MCATAMLCFYDTVLRQSRDAFSSDSSPLPVTLVPADVNLSSGPHEYPHSGAPDSTQNTHADT